MNHLAGLDITRRDVGSLFIAPTVVMAGAFIASLPAPRSPLAYAPAEPTLLTLYGMHFAHSNLSHLLRNLATLWLVGGITFGLLCACKHKRLYYEVFVALVVVFPPLAAPVLHASILHFRPEQYATVSGVGSSGIITALVAFLAVATSLYVHEQIAAAGSPFGFAVVLLLGGAFTPAVVRDWALGIQLGAGICGLLALGYLGYTIVAAARAGTVSLRHLGAVGVGLGMYWFWMHRLLAMKGPGMGFDIHMMGYIGGTVLTLGVVALRRTPLPVRSLVRLKTGRRTQ